MENKMARGMREIVTLVFINVLLVMEFCSAQNQNLIEQNINMLSDRTLQNTVLSRGPIASVINNAIGQGNGSPRIRLLSFSNPSNIGQSNNLRQSLRQGTGQQPLGMLQQGTRRPVPITQLGRVQQLNGLQTNTRRLVIDSNRGGASRQVTVAPTGQLRNRQLAGGIQTIQGRRLMLNGTRGGASLQASVAPNGQLLMRQQQLSRLQTNPDRSLRDVGRGVGTQIRQRQGTQPSSGFQTNQRPLMMDATRGMASRQAAVVPSRQLQRRLQLGGLQTNPGRSVTNTTMGGAPRQILFVRPTGVRQIRNISSVGVPGQSNIRRSGAGQLTRLSNNRQRPRSAAASFRPGPLTRDPRTGLLVQRISARTQQSNSNPLPLGPVPRCRVNMAFVCQPLRRNQDRPRARLCVGTCAARRCVGMCVCACVTRITASQGSRAIDNRLQTVQGQGRSGVSGRSAQPNRALTRQTPNDLNFTLDNSVLAKLLAEPDLNSLIGPEGINQILRGEPPTLLRQQWSGQQGNVTGSGNGTSNTVTTAMIDMGIPIIQGRAQSTMAANPLMANMLTSGEGFREMAGEINSNLLGSSVPSLTEFQRSDVNTARVLDTNNLGDRLSLPATSLDASFLGAILPMPRPISLSRDNQRSRDTTHVVVNPSLLDSGVIQPLRGVAPPRNRFRSLRSRVEAFENVFDANAPFETISDVLSGNNVDAAAAAALNLNMMTTGSGNTVGGLSRDQRFLENIMRTSGNQEPSDVAVMAAMMQTLGGAVDAVSAANSRNNSAGPSRSRDMSGPIDTVRGQSTNQTTGNLIQNFLTGTVKSTDQGMSLPTSEECYAQGRELWCDPSGIWERTPGLTRWCLMNCRSSSNICDQNRCECKCVNTETFRRNMSRHS